MPDIPKKLIFLEYKDHWENENLTLTKEELKRKMEHPITLKSFGRIIDENEEYLVVENFLPRKNHFIFKPAIKVQELYFSNEAVSEMKEQFELQEKELKSKVMSLNLRLGRASSQLQLFNRVHKKQTQEMLRKLKQCFDPNS